MEKEPQRLELSPTLTFRTFLNPDVASFSAFASAYVLVFSVDRLALALRVLPGKH